MYSTREQIEGIIRNPSFGYKEEDRNRDDLLVDYRREIKLRIDSYGNKPAPADKKDASIMEIMERLQVEEKPKPKPKPEEKRRLDEIRGGGIEALPEPEIDADVAAEIQRRIKLAEAKFPHLLTAHILVQEKLQMMKRKREEDEAECMRRVKALGTYPVDARIAPPFRSAEELIAFLKRRGIPLD